MSVVSCILYFGNFCIDVKTFIDEMGKGMRSQREFEQSAQLQALAYNIGILFKRFEIFDLKTDNRYIVLTLY